MRVAQAMVLTLCCVLFCAAFAVTQIQQATTAQSSDAAESQEVTKNPADTSASSVESGKPEPPEPCTLEDTKATLIYPWVGASYVGGTIPGLFIGSPKLFPVVDPYGGHQLKRKGRLGLSPKCILFSFKKDKKKRDNLDNPDISKNWSIFGCQQSSCESPAKDGDYERWVVAIPYKPIVVLSRARYATADLLSISTGYAVASAGLLAALSQGIKNAHTLELSLGGATGGMLLYYYFFVLRPRLTENYLGIFIKNGSSPSNEFHEAEDQNVDQANVEFQGLRKITIRKPSDELFKQSDVVLFRVTNYHDYYNISAILNAETGLTFVSETAEKPTK